MGADEEDIVIDVAGLGGASRQKRSRGGEGEHLQRHGVVPGFSGRPTDL